MSILTVHQKGAIVFLVDDIRKTYSRFQFASNIEALRFLAFVEEHDPAMWHRCRSGDSNISDDYREKG